MTVWFLYERRYHAAFTETPLASWCCTLTWFSQLNGRCPHPKRIEGSFVVVDATTLPKFELVVGPSSLDCSEPSALKIVKSLFRSRHVRTSVRPIVVWGFALDAAVDTSPLT